ncbi:MAG TPA: choice-of-anchor X domain-containing protein, partial [Solirubrobacteraceae bacterium]
MTPPTRRRALLTALAVTGLAAVVVLVGRASDSRPAAPSVAPARAATPAVQAAAVVRPPEPAGPAPRGVPADAEPAARARPRIPAPLGPRAAEEYRRRARYPRSSQPLDPDGDDPIARDQEVTPVRGSGPNGADPTLVVFPARSNFEAPETAVLYATLMVGDHEVPAVDIRGTVVTEKLEPLGEVEYHDDGLGGDAVANDLVYTAVFRPDAIPALSQSYMVQVRAVAGRDEERLAASSFLYSNPHAFLTGQYADALADGSLAVDAELEVLAAGRFHLQATLYSADGTQKLVWAQSAAALEPGRQWMRLSFYGLGLRERGVDGPYLLRYVALATTTDMPNARNRVTENAYVTGRYATASFTDQPFNDPDLLEAAR